VALLGTYSLAAEQGAKVDTTPEKPPAERLPEPYYHSICSASSQDGINWKRDEDVFFEHTSVPCAVAEDDKRIIMYSVDFETAPKQPKYNRVHKLYHLYRWSKVVASPPDYFRR